MTTAVAGSLWPKTVLSPEDYNDLWHHVATDFGQEAQQQRISDAAAADLARNYLPLAAWIHARKSSKPLLIGINGAQGSGKSTASAFLARILTAGYGYRVAVLSIDDLYLPRADRILLAQRVHPLLQTRGVPGTHDVELGLSLFDALTGSSGHVDLPVFDKAQDDRLPATAWRNISTPVDIVLFEGWCVGAKPQQAHELTVPLNTLEASEDTDGHWRRYVNAQLAGRYADFFSRLDYLIMLKVPSMECVLRWRSLQEQKMLAQLSQQGITGTHVMDAATLERFIMHYERLTRHQLNEMPARADITLMLNEAHQFTEVHLKCSF